MDIIHYDIHPDNGCEGLCVYVLLPKYECSFYRYEFLFIAPSVRMLLSQMSKSHVSLVLFYDFMIRSTPENEVNGFLSEKTDSNFNDILESFKLYSN